ncbi:MAG: CapA family protein, partial [Acidimicrobiia bacterium]|nr:CapA family protein [Acidimicrobiia bacterium]
RDKLGVLALSGRAIGPKQFVFRCDPEAYPAAVAAGVDVVNLGNSHSQDYGKAAMLTGRAILEAAGLHPIGAGSNAAEAGRPALIEVGGWTVAVLGFGGVIPS